MRDSTWEDGARTSSKLWRRGPWRGLGSQTRLCNCRGGAHTPQKVGHGMKGLVEIKTERFERLEYSQLSRHCWVTVVNVRLEGIGAWANIRIHPIDECTTDYETRTDSRWYLTCQGEALR